MVLSGNGRADQSTLKEYIKRDYRKRTAKQGVNFASKVTPLLSPRERENYDQTK